MDKLKDIAKIIRSKNASPFAITFDVMFEEQKLYDRFKESNALSREKICELYEIVPDGILEYVYYDQARALKFTLLRRNWPHGSVNERDTFGAQQYVPLFDVEVPTV